jgi:hypothetical protein
MMFENVLCFVRGLEAEKVRKLDDECTLPEVTGQRVPAVVVYKVEIAQGMVNNVEADVRAHLVRVGVVLNERIQEEARRKPVKKASAHEAC